VEAEMDFYIQGLEVYGHHGVPQEEKIMGQRLYFDCRLSIDESRATRSDDVADTIDYTEVLDLITEVATTKSYSLLERIAFVTAEAILKAFPADMVWVQVTKPHPPVACALTSVSASVELTRADLED
jgi:dihydroneopterin aldolase